MLFLSLPFRSSVDPFLQGMSSCSLRRLMQVLNDESDLFFPHWPGLAEEMNCCQLFLQCKEMLLLLELN